MKKKKQTRPTIDSAVAIGILRLTAVLLHGEKTQGKAFRIVAYTAVVLGLSERFENGWIIIAVSMPVLLIWYRSLLITAYLEVAYKLSEYTYTREYIRHQKNPYLKGKPVPPIYQDRDENGRLASVLAAKNLIEYPVSPRVGEGFQDAQVIESKPLKLLNNSTSKNQFQDPVVSRTQDHRFLIVIGDKTQTKTLKQVKDICLSYDSREAKGSASEADVIRGAIWLKVLRKCERLEKEYRKNLSQVSDDEIKN